MKVAQLNKLTDTEKHQYFAKRCLEIVLSRLDLYPKGTNLEYKVKKEAQNMGFGREKAQLIYKAIFTL